MPIKSRTLEDCTKSHMDQVAELSGNEKPSFTVVTSVEFKEDSVLPSGRDSYQITSSPAQDSQEGIIEVSFEECFLQHLDFKRSVMSEKNSDRGYVTPTAAVNRALVTNCKTPKSSTRIEGVVEYWSKLGFDPAEH